MGIVHFASDEEARACGRPSINNYEMPCSSSARILRRPLRILALVTFFAASAAPVAKGETVTINFDAPAFSNGQVLGWVGNVGFFGNVTVFRPTGVATQSGNQAARTPNWCESPSCQNAANQMSIYFRNGRTASSVSVRIGSEMPPFDKVFCFPEGTDCPVYARMVGYSGNNVVVSSADVKIYDGLSLQAPIKTELRIDDPYSRITGVKIFIGKGTFSHEIEAERLGITGRVQIDDLAITFGPPSTPPSTSPPGVTIAEPSAPITYPYQFTVSGTYTAPSGVLALCIRINEVIPQFSQACVNNATIGNGTFSGQFTYASLPPTGNVVNVGLIDLAGRRVAASRPLQVGPPPPPTVTFSLPSAGVWVPDPSRGILVTGMTYVTGPPAGFCLVVTQPPAVAATPSIANCQDQRLLSGVGTGSAAGFSNVSLPGSLFQAGANDITAFVFDAFGQMGRATRRGTVPADLRITAVEITQGSQQFGAHLSSGAYQGTKLTVNVPTVVRVFANAAAGGPFDQVKARLYGIRPHPRLGWESLGVLFPDNGARTLHAGGAVPTLDERADANGAFVFTLPLEWTRTTGLRIRAELNPENVSGGTPECTTCRGNNELEVSAIDFQSAPGTQTISPVLVRWTNAAGVVMDPAPPEEVFSDFRALVPLPTARLIVRPYVTVIDASKALPGGYILRPNGIDWQGGCDAACADEVFGLVAGFEISNQPGFTIGITTASMRGKTTFVAYFRPPTFLTFELVAIASSTYFLEPLKLQVAHELLHQWGYLHASGECGDAANQPSTPWPPDLKGRLQGIGLDRRIGSNRAVPGTYAVIVDRAEPNDAYDVMSYCALGKHSWLSPRYWDVFGQTFTTSEICLHGNCPPLGQFFGGALAEPRPSMRVLAARSSEAHWRIISLRRSQMPSRPTLVAPPDRDYVVVARDRGGREIARARAYTSVPHDRPNVRILSAELPVGDAAQIAVLERGREVAQRKASAHAPRLQLAAPPDVAGDAQAEIRVSWKVGDEDGDHTSVRLDYSADDGTTWTTIGVSASPDGMLLPRRLLSRSDRARIRATATDGFHETAVTSGTFRSDGAPPEVRIAEPSRDLVVLSSATINLQALAFDDRGRPLGQRQLRWLMDGQPLGEGETALILRPAPGRRVITLIGRDEYGREARAERVLEVQDSGFGDAPAIER